MAIVGPGAIQEQVMEPGSSLDGISEYEYVMVLNPLTDDFAVMVAQDIPVNMPMEIRDKTSGVQDRNGLVMQYGQDFKNPDFQGRRHISNTSVIPSGKTVNFRGPEARVAVNQLVNELLQREGKGKLLADPVLRRDTEARIIQKRGYIQDIMDTNMQTPQQQQLNAIDKSNEVLSNEQPFAGLGQPAAEAVTAGSAGSGTEGSPQQRRGPGRPPKAS